MGLVVVWTRIVALRDKQIRTLPLSQKQKIPVFANSSLKLASIKCVNCINKELKFIRFYFFAKVCHIVLRRRVVPYLLDILDFSCFFFLLDQ